MINIQSFINFSKEIDAFLSDDKNIKKLNRLLKIECQHNQNIINCIKTDLSQNNVAYSGIIDLLETNQLEIFLSGMIKKESFINKIIDYKKDSLDETDDLVVNIYLKIKVLKSISKLNSEENKSVKNFRIKQRLKNLKEKLVLLSKELDQRN